MRIKTCIALLLIIVLCGCETYNEISPPTLHNPQSIYRKPKGVKTRWASFENPAATKGGGGTENKGAKGHAFDSLKPGETKTLMNAEGSGTIRRIWITIAQRDAKMLRSLRLDMYWDHSRKPAVSVPLGDFFGAATGQIVPFENAFFSSPEARSFGCTIPMPYRTAAKVAITNESSRPLTHLFYDIDFTQGDKHSDDVLYFHANWRRERWTTLEKDFEILPEVHGEGRFLGCHVGVMLKPGNTGWWGEGEVKVYLDGDSKWPTLVGTGLEDYIGTGWGLGTYVNHYQGSLVADRSSGHYAFYRYHVPDPIYFDKDCRVTIQQIGGGPKDVILRMQENNVNFKPVGVDGGGYDKFTKILEQSPPLSIDDPSFPQGHINVYREDDYSATAFFYLDSPCNNLPKLMVLKKRLEGLKASE